MITPQHEATDTPLTVMESQNVTSGERQQDKLETIRAILVGEEFKELASRLSTVEEDHDGRYDSFRDDLLAKLRILQGQNEEAVAGVGDMVVEMVRQLQEETLTITHEIERIRTKLAGFESRLDRLDDSFAEQVRTYQEETSLKISQLTELVQGQQENLSRQSVSRTDFAKILNGLAGSITQEEVEHE